MKKTFFQLHLSVFIAGFTGVFGKLISLNEGMLVWYRVLLTTVFLLIYLPLIKKFVKVSLKDFVRITKVGIVLSIHWLLFYGSIKASNVSIGVVCFSMIGFFTAILEPLILHRKFSTKELAYSLITVVGVFLIFSFDTRYRLGIGLGVASAAMASVFTIMSKQISHDYNPRLSYSMKW